MIAKAIVKAFKEFRFSLENPRIALTGSNLSLFGGSAKSRSGVRVGVGDALSYSPVWSAVSLISEDCMRIPWQTFEQKLGPEKRLFKHIAYTHPVCNLLDGSIAPMSSPGRMTSDVWVQKMIAHALLFRGAYSRIYRDNITREVSRLEWIHSDRVEADIDRGSKFFRVAYGKNNEPGHDEKERINESDMFFIEGLAMDDLGGLSLVDFARNSIGRALAAEDFGDEFFANAGVPNGWFETPLAMSDPAIKRFMNRMIRAHGPGSRHKFGLLEEGMKWTASGISPKDALLIESLKFGVADVARWFRIPLHKLADPSRQGYNTTEMENQAFVSSTLAAWLSRLEKQADDKLFTETSKRRKPRQFYTKFKISEYTKADVQARAESNAKAVAGGWLTRNEVRIDEDRNPIEGLDEPLTPANMLIGTEPTPAVEPAERLVAAAGMVRSVVEDCANRLERAGSNAAKNSATFGKTLNEFEEKHLGVITQKLKPACILGRSFGGVMDESKLAEELIINAREAYLTASECQETELQQRAANVRLDVDSVCACIFRSEYNET